MRRPTAAEQAIIDAAETSRANALTKAIEIADDLISRKTAAANGGFQFLDGDARTILAINRWTYTTQIATPFWETLEKARNLMKQNQALGVHTHWVDTTSTVHAYAAPDNSPNLFLPLNGFFADNTLCQREVVLHGTFTGSTGTVIITTVQTSPTRPSSVHTTWPC